MRRTIGAPEHRRKCASRKQGGADEASPHRDPERPAIRFRDQREETMMELCRNALRTLGAALVIGLGFISGASAQTGNPIRVGMSLALTGAGAAPSKVINTALEMWRDDVNAKGGLLGRPVELVIYDDQSAPANVPNIYTKLITVDKVDLLLGPYGTNFVAPAMPVIIQNNKMTISFTAIGINDKFHYSKYFSMVSVGPEGVNAFSIGFFDLAAAQTPKPQTVAILAADAEFAQSAAHGAREEIKKHGFKIVYDKSYPPSTTDFAPVVRAIRATDPDIVYIGAYPPDRPRGERPDRGRELRRGFGAENPRLRRLPQTLWGKSGGRPDRLARLRLGPVRLFGRPDLGASGDRDKKPRSRQARRVHAQGELQDRVGRLLVRRRRRMVEGAHGLDPGPERAAQQPRSVP
ncbi:MAG: hypothetical protein E6G77_25600 [Alphaproteobacteria bacterium]|nr:MAG: hypothetical protein E6G77_25600 [Alphaproteobacteria bacterium]